MFLVPLTAAVLVYLVDSIVRLWIVTCLGDVLNTFAYVDIDISDDSLRKC